jgi:hypothetical protein
LVDLLLSNGGDVTIQNTLGKDSLQVASESLQVLQGSEEAMRQAEEIFDLLRNVKEYEFRLLPINSCSHTHTHTHTLSLSLSPSPLQSCVLIH